MKNFLFDCSMFNVNMKYPNFIVKYWLVFSLLFSSLLFPQNYPKLKFHRLGVKQNLSSNTVNEVAQDSLGFLWIGTENGLNRFDGYNVEHFSHDENDSTSLPGNMVLSIFLDSKNILWVGTASGLAKFDHEKRRFYNYAYKQEDKNSISDNSISDIIEDEKGNLWVSTFYGLNYFNRETETFRKYFHKVDDKSSIPDNSIQELSLDHKGNLWIASTYNGLAYFDFQENKITRYKHDPKNKNSISHNRLRALTIAGNDLWIGTFRSGLNKMDLSTGKITKYNHDPEVSNSLGSNRVTSIMSDSKKRIWVTADEGGVNIYNPNSEGFHQYRFIDFDPFTIVNEKLRSIFEDRYGNIWITHYRGGVSYASLKDYKPFDHHYHIPKNDNSLNHDIVTSIVEDNKGNVWVGTDGGGLNLIDNFSENISHIRHEQNNPNSPSDDAILSLLEDGDYLWIGSYLGGLSRLNKKTRIFKHYIHNPNDPQSISHNDVRQIFKDSKGYIWAATWGDGISRLNTKTGKFKNFRADPSDSSSILSFGNWFVYEDKLGTIWVGSQEGLSRLNEDGKTFTNYTIMKDCGLTDKMVTSSYEDSYGNLWFGTNRGLHLYDRINDRFRSYNRQNSLPNDFIKAITEDSNGNLFLSTARGIVKFNIEKKSIVDFNLPPDVQDQEFCRQAVFKNKEGKLYFGGLHGFISFFPDSIKTETFVPNILLTEFSLDNKRISVDKLYDGNKILEKDIALTQKIVLDYHQSDFEIRFASPHFTDPHQLKYFYFLEGYDKEWKKTASNIRQAAYTNLSPGDYIFKVYATNSDGISTSQIKELHISILNPFWATFWFRIFIALCLFLVIFLLYRLRVKQLKERSIFLEENNIKLNEQIIERNKAEEALKSEKGYSDNIINNSPAIICGIDSNGIIKFINPAGEKITGYTKEEIIGANWWDIFYPREQFYQVKKLFRAFSSGDINNYEMLLVSKDKSEKIISWNSIIHYNKRGELDEIIGFGNDITDRVNAENDLNQLNKELEERVIERTDELESLNKELNDFAYIVSHDLKAPLRGISQLASWISEDYSDKLDEDGKENLEILLSRVAKMNSLIEGVLTYSRAGRKHGKIEEVDLCSSVKEVIEFLTLPENVEIKIDNKLPVLQAEKLRIDQVFQNIISNAVKYNDKDKCLIEIYSLPDEKYHKIFIKDNGPGIDKKYHEKVFGIFQSLGGNEDSTGVGLSIVKKIIENMHGKVDVISPNIPDKDGSNFVLKIPKQK